MFKALSYKNDKKPIWFANTLIAFLFMIVCLVWATTWLGIKIAVETIPPFTSAGLRFLIASPMFLTLAWIRGETIWFPRRLFPFFICITIFYFTIPYWLINFSAQYVSSGLMALTFSTMPVFTLVLSVIVLKERIFFSQIIGIAIGFLSLMMVIKLHLNLGYSSLMSVILILISVIMQGFLYIFIKKLGANISTITLHALPMSIAGTFLTMSGLIFEQPNFVEFSQTSVLALIYLSCITLVGSNTYFFLIKQMNLTILSFVFIIFPAIAVFIGAWYESIPLSNDFLFYTTLLLVGFAITKFPIEKLIQLIFKSHK